MSWVGQDIFVVAVVGIVGVLFWRGCERLVLTPIVGGYFGLLYIAIGHLIHVLLVGLAVIGLARAAFNVDELAPVLRIAIGAGSLGLLVLLIPSDYANLLERRQNKQRRSDGA